MISMRGLGISSTRSGGFNGGSIMVNVNVLGLSRRFMISSRPKWAFNVDLKKWFSERAYGRTLHLCCGLTHFDFAVNLDVDRKAKMDILADMFSLPFRNDAFDTIICDPPYRLAIHRRGPWSREMFRVIRKQKGSRILLKTDFIPYFPGFTLKELVVYQGARYWAPISLLLYYQLDNPTLLDWSGS